MEKHEHGGDVYSYRLKADYSANINPLGLSPHVAEVLKNSIPRVIHYPDVECRKLRRLLAEKEQVREESLIFGNGAAELIFALTLGLKPKKALLAAPGFAEYEQALNACGAEISYYPLKKENGFAVAHDYLSYLTEDLDLVFLCNPNNPTGVLIDEKLLVEILKECEKKKILLVLDECFNGFLDDAEERTMKPYVENSKALFLLKAFTKLYAMPGLRLGYGISSNREVLEQMQSVLQPWNLSVLAQEAGIAALEDGLYVEEARCIVKEERRYLFRGLQSLGFKAVPPTANYVFFEGPRGLKEECLKEGYLIRDCGNYRGLCEGYYRIAVRLHKENEAFLKALEKCAAELKQRD
ncbi:MAG TPA: aminotransferase class I/II-fold pyridoxal phosphate-dependent enzyme [Candidatus Limivivens merdigallinarum]|uniref:Aminotransferase class I/II-fold pyridoxal phosphate-dependent enzyme n=1 Tax=Candidatus Limivivens merdigallinarum TaxID=2840859 RepID=A0A9D0ZVA0_9FIRM|nr:aminotransferase class I/II-fold pyridoxal phosphate-dependent enzyme [Candidatus Limivivens merdigallinarum]